MKLSLCLLTLFLLTSIVLAQQPGCAPLRVDTGYCSFPESASVSWVGDESTNNPFFKFFKSLKGIPTNWTHVRKTIIWMNGYQFFYQNYITGEISPEFYKDLQQQMQWSPDESLMSKKHLDCYVYLVSGRDEKGQEWMLIDANNNKDVGDDIPFIPIQANQPDWEKLHKNVHYLHYETIVNKKVIRDSSPVTVLSSWGRYSLVDLSNWRATLYDGDSTYTLRVPSVTEPLSILMVTGESRDTAYYHSGDYIRIGQKKYKYVRVNPLTRSLELENVSATEDLYGVQPGYKAIPFRAPIFGTDNFLSLDQFKGKTVVLHFWGTFCGPCLAEIPELKRVYNHMDTSQVAFISVAVGDNPATLKKFLQENKLPWPVILSDTQYKISEAYSMHSLPTTLLIGPDGRILDKILFAEQLEGLPGEKK